MELLTPLLLVPVTVLLGFPHQEGTAREKQERKQPAPALDLRLGGRLVALGDVDQDGIGDLAFGTGTVLVVSGRSGRVIHRIAGEFEAAACAGDVDGDSTPDLAVVSGWRPPEVVVFSGRDASPLLRVGAEVDGRALRGRTVAGVGDWNGDGRADLGVSARVDRWSRDSGDPDAVLILSGRDGSLLHVLDCLPKSRKFGGTLVPLGDVDGDGRPDLLVGGVDYADLGYVLVVAGGTGRTLLELRGSTQGHEFAASASDLGDVDGDGRSDVALGEWRDGAPRRRVHVIVHSGATGEVLYGVASDEPWCEALLPIARAGDLNGDGVPDFLVAGGTTARYVGLGVVTAYSGKSGAVLRRWEAQGGLECFGKCLAGLGDVDGDGLADIAIASALGLGATDPDVVQVFSGGSGTELYRLGDSRTSDSSARMPPREDR